MTAARLEEIRASIMRAHGSYGCETPEERTAIKAYWETMPGYTCYYDAVCQMLKEAKERERKP